MAATRTFAAMNSLFGTRSLVASTFFACLMIVVVASFSHAADETDSFLAAYCLACHAGDDAEGSLRLDSLSWPPIEENRKRWEQVVGKLRSSEMPPKDAEQPPPDLRQATIQKLQAQITKGMCDGPRDPGRAILRRMNRNEFQNTIRDVLKIDGPVALQFPPDELAYGFDNNGDMLSLSPIWLESLLGVAEKISYQAFRAPEQVNEPRHAFPKEKW